MTIYAPPKTRVTRGNSASPEGNGKPRMVPVYTRCHSVRNPVQNRGSGELSNIVATWSSKPDPSPTPQPTTPQLVQHEGNRLAAPEHIPKDLHLHSNAELLRGDG